MSIFYSTVLLILVSIAKLPCIALSQPQVLPEHEDISIRSNQPSLVQQYEQQIPYSQQTYPERPQQPVQPQGYRSGQFTGSLYQDWLREQQLLRQTAGQQRQPRLPQSDGSREDKSLKNIALGGGALSGGYMGVASAATPGLAVLGSVTGAAFGAGLTRLRMNMGRPNPLQQELARRREIEEQQNHSSFWPIFFFILVIAVIAVFGAVATVAFRGQKEEFYEDLPLISKPFEV